MIVLIETNVGIKKYFFRDKIFFEIDDNNKKIKKGTVKTLNSKYVLWAVKDKIEKIPILDWLQIMERRNFSFD